MKKLLYKLTPLALILLIWSACKDDDMGTLNLKRRFQPGQFDITEGETSVTIAWDASVFTLPGEVEYEIQLSKDPAFGTVEVSTTTAETEVVIPDTDIDIRTDYYARVKALGSGRTDDSNWLVSEVFQITGEIFMLPIQEHEILVTSAIISWETEGVIAKIVATPQGGGGVLEFTVSAGEATAGTKTITGLTANTSYVVEIFNAEDVGKGSIGFRTKPSYAESNVIDLTGITGNPKILRDTLQDIPSGSVILLKRGEVYTIDNTDAAGDRLINKSVTFVSAAEANPQFARIHLTTNFNFVASSVIDSVVFKDVIIRGVRPAGASFDNDYIINSNVSATVAKIRLENCNISKLRGVVRLQAAAPGTQVANYYINNCVVDSVREFAVVMASAGSAFANVKVTNSTFSHCRRYVNHGVAGNNSLEIANCTFNDLPSGGVEGAEANYFIDFNAANSANPVLITNCILGRTWNEGAGTFVRGVRSGGATNFNVTNTYTLSDFISTSATFLIPGVSTYTGSSTQVFTDPNNENFTIKDSGFPGATTAGDPRWRQ
jgi:hypothetical protein